MNKGPETVHIAFGRAIADTLRGALPLLGSRERVIGLPMALSVGPIDPPDPKLRQAWAKAALQADTRQWADLDGDPLDAETAWAEATAPEIAPVFWACLNSPMEHACFLAFAARRQGRIFDSVDATNLDYTTVDGVRRPGSLGMMRVQDIVASNLYATRRSLSSDEQHQASQAWSKLCQDNAPFRIVREGRLVSAPLTHYDGFLIEHASQSWEIAAQLIGRVITRLSFENTPPGQGTGDTVLFGRMLALGKAGVLEIAGVGPGMRDYHVRQTPA